MIPGETIQMNAEELSIKNPYGTVIIDRSPRVEKINFGKNIKKFIPGFFHPAF